MSVRLISPNPRYSLQLVGANVKRGTDSTGTVVEFTESDPVVAEFRQLGLTEWEQIAALQHFSFAGLADGVHPLSQVSCWDSEANALERGWSDEFHQVVEARARKLAGLFPSNILAVDKPRTAKPWQSYDEMELEEIIATLDLVGNDPASVRLYEVENKARPEVIEAIEARQAQFDPEVIEATELEKLRAELEELKGSLAAPVVEGVASEQDVQPSKVQESLAKARAAKAAKAAEAKAATEGEGVTVNV